MAKKKSKIEPLIVIPILSVTSTNIFKGFDDLSKAFGNGDGYDFSWGDNQHSLITQQQLVEAVEQAAEQQNISEKRVEKFREHVYALQDDVYIDLEH